MLKKVLIVTNCHDLHADLLVPNLTAKGCDSFRINLDAFPRNYHLAQSLTNDRVVNKIRDLQSENWLDFEAIGAIWMRKPGEFRYLSDDLTTQEKNFAKAETEHALLGLLYGLNCFWMSHPLALRAAQWKGEQLQRAKRMGFRIPATIITNSKTEALAFRDSLCGPMIFKAMSDPSLGADDTTSEERINGGISTTIVDSDMSLDAVDHLPCQFQEYVSKKYELRVTIIGDKVFAAKIHSQNDTRTMIDSRDMSAEILYEETVLSQELRERCIAFVKSYGLIYGALDLIVTPDDEVVFLENNPTGQFLYIEELIPTFKLIDAVADELIAGMSRVDATC